MEEGYKPSEEAIEWVATHLSHESFLEDWILSACFAFEAGRKSGRLETLAVLQEHDGGGEVYRLVCEAQDKRD